MTFSIARIQWVAALLCSTLLWVSSAGQVGDEQIRKHVEELIAGRPVTLAGEAIYSTQLLPKIYQKKSFGLIWDEADKSEFLKSLASAEEDGLNSNDYHYNTLVDPQSGLSAAGMDVLLTDAYLLYASHLLNGKTNPETVDSQWKALRREGNALDLLEESLETGNIPHSLKSLRPMHPGYAGLVAALKKYRKIAQQGGWTVLPEGPTLKEGMVDSIRVPLLIKRLQISSDLATQPIDIYTYTTDISAAITHFQLRHGLATDGNLGKMTIAALNVPIARRIDQIEVNMERYRWLSQNLGRHHAIVNIADFQMYISLDDSITYREKVIVGKLFRKTPVFSGNMTYMVLNPTWTVPKTILTNDVLPALQKDPGYLAIKNMKAFDLRVSTTQAVNPTSVDWSQFSKTNFPFMIRQEPGELNALGQVKFMFPNGFDVYVHDTPNRELFKETQRLFSSGCIRLNSPMSLVEYHIKNDPAWDMTKIKEVIASGKTQTVLLKEAMPIHILYLTAWSENGTVHFRQDVYQRDATLLKALNQTAPVL
jgi:murein L,D-transpeptidase YcbB/YkuD